MCVCVCVRICVCAYAYIYRLIDHKELAHKIMRLWGLASPKASGRPSRPETHKELMVQMKSKGLLLGEFCLAQERPIFCSIQAFS